MKLERIDGKNFYYMFLAGARKIIENQTELNRINVYPVPDGDTGTNMASTIRMVVDSISPNPSFKVTADAIGIAALEGARGNSGIIFAQFLFGFSEEIRDCTEITIKEFAESLKRSIKYLYEAVANPVEGTILTVIREWVEFIHEHRLSADDFSKLIHDSYEVAKVSLAETKEKLAILKKSNVVDAGAKGFVVFLEGMMDMAMNRNVKKVLKFSAEAINGGVKEEIPSERPVTRYCTEAMIEGGEIDKRKLKELLKSYGDSVVVAGSERKARLHVHTDHPSDLFIHLREHGTITFQKVEDMVKQYESAHKRKYKIALVTDSTCDLPEEITEKYQIFVLPINLVVDGNHYLDGITIKSEEFYKINDLAKEVPSTAQPSRSAFINLYSQLTSYFDSVISIHLSDKLSGTYSNSVMAAEQVSEESGKKIDVIDSVSITCGLGMLVNMAAELIESGKQHDDIVKSIRLKSAPNNIFVSIRTLKYFVRSGRVSPLKGMIAGLLNLLPVITVGNSGKAELMQKTLSYKANRQKVMTNVKNGIKGKKLYAYSISHVASPDDAKFFLKEMKELTGSEPMFVTNVTPSLGLHTGKGTVAVSFVTA